MIYVKLVLEVGLYDADVVDAYYGPKEWQEAVGEPQTQFPHKILAAKARSLQTKVGLLDLTIASPDEQARYNMLNKQLTAIATKINMLGGIKYSF